MSQTALKNLVAIEGGDGSGKGTQAKLLQDYMSEKLEKNVFKTSFPRYDKPSGYYAGNYLDGQYGTTDQVHPDLGVLAYAIDRFDASKDMRRQLSLPNSFGILDRYMGSNLAHQGAKIADSIERKKFYERTMQLEYDILGIPRPALNIVLLMPTNLAQANIDKKDALTRSYTAKKRDIHEADADHLDKAKANYEELCRLYPDEFTAINCTDDDGKMRSIDDIQQEIRQLIGL